MPDHAPGAWAVVDHTPTHPTSSYGTVLHFQLPASVQQLSFPHPPASSHGRFARLPSHKGGTRGGGGRKQLVRSETSSIERALEPAGDDGCTQWWRPLMVVGNKKETRDGDTVLSTNCVFPRWMDVCHTKTPAARKVPAPPLQPYTQNPRPQTDRRTDYTDHTDHTDHTDGQIDRPSPSCRCRLADLQSSNVCDVPTVYTYDLSQVGSFVRSPNPIVLLLRPPM